jgi:3-methyl-2-oxobutanoate hydroxymethyltransferase
MNDKFNPRFLRRFAEVGAAADEGIRAYLDAVRSGEYPGDEHTFS